MEIQFAGHVRPESVIEIDCDISKVSRNKNTYLEFAIEEIRECSRQLKLN